jgi:hypothetical protein
MIASGALRSSCGGRAQGKSWRRVPWGFEDDERPGDLGANADLGGITTCSTLQRGVAVALAAGR